ncbi:zinc ribbon domain-containing protein [Pararobbsia silviterrae]|uniref:Zinc ribbon domain-containing protein n=1 Tax=Pararobbsia silviterrae TaxID=1792498 RepID=A0A494Y5T2_9BURK|nr:zinc ribbon domain-containing protein [Pararobbsia silviterrae]RKP57452.1 zinc ribbon domain-containing protein [Pararobbsia silviterrae]
MPTYDYRCESCGVFTVMRRIADRDTDCACPECGTLSTRTISMPQLALMAGTARAGHQINERAAHAPQHSSAYRHVHGPGCGCGSSRKAATGQSGAQTGAPGAMKGNPSARPWMISH